jgi:hypothetical protein
LQYSAVRRMLSMSEKSISGSIPCENRFIPKVTRSTLVGAHQVSNMHSTDLPMLSPTPLDQDDSIAWPGYLPASHLLTRLPCWFGSHATTPGAPSRRRTLWVGEMVSITSSVWTVLRRYGRPITEYLLAQLHKTILPYIHFLNILTYYTTEHQTAAQK